MARTATGRALTELHRRQQLALRADVLRQVLRLWPTWNLHEPDTYVALQDALVAITQVSAERSATLAAAYYRLFRLAEQPVLARDIALGVMLASAPSVEQIKKAIDATAKSGVYNAFKAGKSYEEALANGLVRVSGSVGRLAMEGGRSTIEQTVMRDKLALGYARVTGGRPCAFCAMLASRGPVYKEDTVDFQAHDHCSCTSEPVYPGSEWPGRAREFRELWDESGSLNTFRANLAKGAA